MQSEIIIAFTFFKKMLWKYLKISISLFRSGHKFSIIIFEPKTNEPPVHHILPRQHNARGVATILICEISFVVKFYQTAQFAKANKKFLHDNYFYFAIPVLFFWHLNQI